jgi:hypothetical protein
MKKFLTSINTAMQNLTVQELAIVIAVEKIDPTLLTPEFLSMTQIVPSDWEVLGQPVRSFEGSHITYQQGLSIITQPQRISFVELIINKEVESIEVAKIAKSLVKVLANLKFVGVGINFRGYLDFAGQEVAAQRFMFSHLLALGDWQKIGTAPVQAGINLGYTFPDKRLNLTINEATVQQPDQSSAPIILFSGNFDYELNATDSNTGLAKLEQILADWQQDMQLYKDVVEKFKQTDTVINFPAYSA